MRIADLEVAAIVFFMLTRYNDAMDEKEKGKLWVERWKRAGPELEAQRRADIRAGNLEDFTRATAGMLEGFLDTVPIRLESGLAQQQAFFRKAARGAGARGGA